MKRDENIKAILAGTGRGGGGASISSWVIKA